MQKDFVENCQKFSGFVRQTPQKGLKKKYCEKCMGSSLNGVGIYSNP